MFITLFEFVVWSQESYGIYSELRFAKISGIALVIVFCTRSRGQVASEICQPAFVVTFVMTYESEHHDTLHPPF